jgi:hypothetical protein
MADLCLSHAMFLAQFVYGHTKALGGANAKQLAMECIFGIKQHIEISNFGRRLSSSVVRSWSYQAVLATGATLSCRLVSTEGCGAVAVSRASTFRM